MLLSKETRDGLRMTGTIVDDHDCVAMCNYISPNILSVTHAHTLKNIYNVPEMSDYSIMPSTAHSFVELVRYLFKVPGEGVLSRRLCQDPLEKSFLAVSDREGARARMTIQL